MADYESRLNIEVESTGVDKAKKSLAELTRAGDNAEKATSDLGKAGRQAGNDLNRASTETSRLTRETESLAKASQLASGALATSAKAIGAGLIAGVSISALAGITDQYTKLSGQLKIATESQAEFNKAFSDVRRIATQSQSDLGTVSALYSRLSLSLREIGVSSVQVASITETVSLALKASGAGAGETASTMLQLSQAFGSGVLRGEEFNAVMEASPNLMRALAQSIGVPIGQLRALAADGQITSDVLVKAFSDESLLNNFREQARQVQTISGAMTTLKNSLVLLGGELNNQTGAGSAFSTVLVQIARSIEGLASAIKGDLKGSIDSLLPSYEKYLQARKQQLEDEKKIAGIERQQIIPQGQRLGQVSIPGAGGTIGEYNAVFAQLKKQFDDLRASNPLKDVTAATQEYAQKVAIVKANLLAMNITQDEANRYLAQFKTDLDRATGAQDKKNKAVKSGADDQKKAIDSLIESARRIAPINEDDIAQLQRKLDTTKNLTSSQKSLVQAEIEAAKVRQEAANDDAYINRMQDYAIAVQDTIDSLKESIQRQQDENLVRSGLADSVESLVIARKEEKLEMLRGLGASDETIAALQKEIDMRKQLADETQKGRNIDAQKKAEQERVRETEKANEQIKRDYERTYESIQRSLTDALLRGFESGKSFAENFRDTLINMFKTLVLRPAIDFILSPITQAVSQGIAGGANTGIVGTANNIFSNLSNVFTNTNSSIISGIEGIGATIANGMGGIRDSIGGFIGANAASISNMLSYGGALLQLSQGNFAGAAGTAIGTFFGGAAGGAIGGAIGSAVGSLFGGKSPPMVGSEARGTFTGGTFTGKFGQYGKKDIGAGSALNDLNKAFATSLGTLLGEFGLSDSVTAKSIFRQRTNVKGFFGAEIDGAKFWEFLGKGISFENFTGKVLGEKLVKAIQLSKLPESIRDLFDGITDKTQVQTMIQATINLNNANDALIKSFDITAVQAASVAAVSGLTGDALAQFVQSLTDAGNATLSVGDSLIAYRDSLTESLGGTLFANLNAFDAALKSIDTSTEEGVQAFYDLFTLRDEFITFQNSMASLKGNVKSALLGIVSDSEKQQILQDDLSDLFEQLNLSVPTTIDELIALGKSIDYTTASGITLANAFPSLVAAFTATQSVIESLTKTTDDFSTQFEYLRYQALAKNFGTSFANSFVPSFAVGTNYVPNDGLAMIHQGERIIPRADNAKLMQDSADMLIAIQSLRSDVDKLNTTMQANAVSSAKTAKSLDNIERGGVIISDIGIDGNEQILKVEVVA